MDELDLNCRSRRMSPLFSLPHPAIVKKLLGWNKIAEDKLSEKAITILAKKLKKKDALEELLKALANQDQNTKCVTIPKLVNWTNENSFPLYRYRSV